MPIPGDIVEGTPTDAHVQFSFFVNDLLESPGAAGSLAVLTRVGLTGAYQIAGVYAKSKRVLIWHVAASAGTPEVVAAVALSGPAGINDEDDTGHAPLELACYGGGGDEAVAAAIVAAGACPDRHCKLNRIHPLVLALVHRNWLVLARALLVAGATPPLSLVDTVVQRKNFAALDLLAGGWYHIPDLL